MPIEAVSTSSINRLDDEAHPSPKSALYHQHHDHARLATDPRPRRSSSWSFRRLREARTPKCFHHGRDDDENLQDVFFFGISQDERIEYCARMSIGGTDSTGETHANRLPMQPCAPTRCMQCVHGVSESETQINDDRFVCHAYRSLTCDATSVNKCIFSETRLRNDPRPMYAHRLP